MKARISIKLALFCALSAIACVIANSFIGLLELDYVTEALWFVSYISAVIWTCKYVGKIKKVGKNVTVSYFTFALALYLGVYAAVIADGTIAEYGYLAFYITAIVCLGSVLVLIGRLIFGGSAQEKEQSTPDVPVSSCWICSCGKENSGKFCADCGAGKPEVNANSAEKE